MVVHLAAAAHHVAEVFELVAVARAAGQITLFEHVHVLTLHLAVTHEVAGGSQRGEAAADDIGRFVVHALRLFGSCKCFIVAARIIHGSYLHKKSGNNVLCFPFDGMSILQIPKMRHKQKTPCDKVLITGHCSVQFFIKRRDLMQACPRGSGQARRRRCRGSRGQGGR